MTATIGAARAGEAGKVKNLSIQTANSTDAIAPQTGEAQNVTGAARAGRGRGYGIGGYGIGTAA